MDGQQLLQQHLQNWANDQGVVLRWHGGTLRLESDGGQAGAVVSFDDEFWHFFELGGAMAKEIALESIALSVALEYRPPAAQFAHDIQIPLDLVKPN